MAEAPETLRAQIFAVVRAVPSGGIVSYGDVARVCGTIPVVVGKALAFCPDDVPWQRVIGRDGTLRTARRGAEFALRQRALLEAEGIRFDAEEHVAADDEGWERGLEVISRFAPKQRMRDRRVLSPTSESGSSRPPGDRGGRTTE
jgi:methylated-DNA-protein-cysteine methyltransferase-like protein